MRWSHCPPVHRWEPGTQRVHMVSEATEKSRTSVESRLALGPSAWPFSSMNVTDSIATTSCSWIFFHKAVVKIKSMDVKALCKTKIIQFYVHIIYWVCVISSAFKKNNFSYFSERHHSINSEIVRNEWIWVFNECCVPGIIIQNMYLKSQQSQRDAREWTSHDNTLWCLLHGHKRMMLQEKKGRGQKWCSRGRLWGQCPGRISP